MRIDNVFIGEHPDGFTEMVVRGPWTAGAARAFEAENVDRLVLNYALGFSEPSLKFLSRLTVRQLVVLDRTGSLLPSPIYDLSPSLQRLEFLVPGSAAELDLARLSSLTSLSVSSWNQIKKSVRYSKGLTDLYVGGYKPTTIEPLAHLAALESLVLKDVPGVESLTGLEGLTRLRQLSVPGTRKLRDVSAIKFLIKLEELNFESCRGIAKINAVEGCHSLQSLNIANCGHVESLRPLAGLSRLRELYMWGSTVIDDGDLTPLMSLPELTQFRSMSRRTYKPSVEAVQELIASRQK